MATKVCYRCKKRKSVTEFNKHPAMKSGRLNLCKVCHNAYERGYRRKHPEIVKRRDAKKARSVKNRFTTHRASARRRKIPWTLDIHEYVLLVTSPCRYCGGSLPETGSGLDQAVSGNGYTPENARPCCSVCNVVKNNIFTEEEMIRLGTVIRCIRLDRPDDAPLIRRTR